MREAFRFTAAAFSVPFLLIGLCILAAVGFIMGYSYVRTYSVLADEMVDALDTAKARLIAGGKRK